MEATKSVTVTHINMILSPDWVKDGHNASLSEMYPATVRRERGWRTPLSGTVSVVHEWGPGNSEAREKSYTRVGPASFSPGTILRRMEANKADQALVRSEKKKDMRSQERFQAE